MLYLSRKLGESIIINNAIELQVTEIKGKSVKLGFVFPPDASVLRKEIFDKIRDENLAASSNSGTDSQLDDLLCAFGSGELTIKLDSEDDAEDG